MDKKKYIRKILKTAGLLLLMISVFFIQGPSKQTVYAAEKKSEELAGAVGFTQKAIFPENQMDDSLGYYQLKMEPNQQEKIKIQLSNPNDQPVTVKIGLNSGKTNANGVIEYGDSKIENDASLKYDFAKIVTGPDKVELAAKETKDAEFTIQMPEESYDGLVVGGIQLGKAEDDKSNEANKGSTVINKYQYIIGVVLQETNVKLTPDLKFNKVYAGLSNYRNAVFVNFSNIVAEYLDHMTLKVQIHKKGDDAVLYEKKQTEMRMAPNTAINYPVSLNGERMVAGDYVADVLATSGAKKWEWKEEFKISEEQAAKFNDRDVALVREEGPNWKMILLVVGAVLLVVGIICAVVYVTKKRKKNNPNKPGDTTHPKGV